MEKHRLIQYLRTILRLESECRTLELSIENKATQYERLSRPCAVEPPKLESTSLNYPFLVFAVLLILGSIASTVYLLPTASFAGDIIVLIFFGIIILACFLFLCFKLADKAAANSNNIKMKQTYKDNIASAEQQTLINQKNAQLVLQDYNILKRQYQETLSVLEKYYNLGVIYKNYCSMVPVSMFVQYLESGRADKLEGHEGCYNLYENDLKFQIIVSELQSLRSDLRHSMSVLYDSLDECNRNVSRLNEQSIITNQHLAVMEYHEEQTAQNSRALAEYAIMRDLFRR